MDPEKNTENVDPEKIVEKKKAVAFFLLEEVRGGGIFVCQIFVKFLSNVC